MEIERKFTVKQLPDLSEYTYLTLTQGYLCTEPVLRVRKENNHYYLTYKGEGLLEREEYNLRLDKESFDHLLQKTDGVIISKKRYLIPYNKHTIELDIFEGSLEPLIIAEVEFASVEEANAFTPPEWFDEDVTMNPQYSNAYLSKQAKNEK